jgi:hypothetical protein
MNPLHAHPPELDEERWNAWVKKGRTGDAARSRRRQFIAAILVSATAFTAGVYFFAY